MVLKKGMADTYVPFQRQTERMDKALALSMKEIGSKINATAREGATIMTESYTLEIGQMTRSMVMGYSSIGKERDTKASGLKISVMGME